VSSGSASFDQVVAAVLDHRDGRCHLRVLSDADAEALAAGLHQRADRLGAERAEIAGAEGLAIACEKGCSACCRVPVMVYEAEAIAVARWLSRPGNDAARESFERRYPAWRAALGELLDALVERHAAGDFESAGRLYNEISDRDQLCAFNRDGACSIYPVRPNACRYFIALETSEHCQVGAERGPAILDHPPYDDFVEKARILLRSAQAISGDPAPRPLCDRVRELA
jgi:Fe-S-cluster containining protein